MSRWHRDVNDDAHGVVFGEHPCPWDYCPDEHVHVFTDAELRARDERIIRAAWFALVSHDRITSDECTPIIAAAEADQKETP